VNQNILYLDIDVDEAMLKFQKLIDQKYRKNQNIFESDLKVMPANISKYIDCGKMNDEIYVDYINRIFDSSLNIQTLIKLDPTGNKSTRVEISANYVFTSIETGTSWRFNTNNPKLILVGNPAYGAEPYRKCLSKNLIESELIEEIAEFNKYFLYFYLNAINIYSRLV
jgi:paraquat-inducible protein B